MPSLSGLRIYPTYSLLERTDSDEWIALSSEAKEIFQLIVSAGTVSFSEGSHVRDILLEIFPEGTITGNRLRTL